MIQMCTNFPQTPQLFQLQNVNFVNELETFKFLPFIELWSICVNKTKIGHLLSTFDNFIKHEINVRTFC